MNPQVVAIAAALAGGFARRAELRFPRMPIRPDS
jgi:hypothetical protein